MGVCFKCECVSSVGAFLVWECVSSVGVFQVCQYVSSVGVFGSVFQVFTTAANLVAFPSIWKRSVLS